MGGSKLLGVVMALGIVIFMSSCKPKEPQSPATSSFTLKMKAKYGNQPFALGTANIDSAGRYIVINTLQFYLSNISLIKTDGSKTNIDSLSIFVFSDTASLSVTVNNVTGDFTGISFGCGVDSLHNTDRTDSVFPNPYSGLWGMYWSMLNYRFEVMEGKWDTAAYINGGMRNALGYHVGTNVSYRQTQLNKAFSVCCGTNTSLVLYVDVAKIISNPTTGEAIDIATQSYTNSSGVTDPPATLVTMRIFADNFSNAFTF